MKTWRTLNVTYCMPQASAPTHVCGVQLLHVKRRMFMEVLTKRHNHLRKYNVMSLKDIANKISNMKSNYCYKLKMWSFKVAGNINRYYVYTKSSVVYYYATFYSHMFFVKYGDPLHSKLLLAKKNNIRQIWFHYLTITGCHFLSAPLSY